MRYVWKNLPRDPYQLIDYKYYETAYSNIDVNCIWYGEDSKN